MFKKITHRQLIFLLGIFLVIILIDRIFDAAGGDSNFKKDFIHVDSASVSEIIIHAPADQHEEVRLSRSEGGWIAQKGNSKGPADMALIKNIIDQLINLKPGRLAATTSEKWKDFQVDDSSGTRLKVMQGEQEVLSIVVGKFSYQQQSRSGLSYIRPAGEEEVFATDGFLAMAFSQGYLSYRDKKIIKGNVNDWMEVQVNVPGDTSFVLNREGDRWMTNDALDSAKVVTYLNSISTVRGSEFEDGYEPAQTASYSLVIKGNNEQGVQLEAYKKEDGDYILHSSQNPQTYFLDRGGVTFKRLFPAYSSFEL